MGVQFIRGATHSDRPARKVIKSARWLLLRNRENLKTAEQAVRLDELLAANQSLMTVYVLKEGLKRLWRYRHVGHAKRLWEGWYRRAMDSGIAPLMQFARRLRSYLPGHPGPLSPPAAYQRARRHQQPHQGHQTHGLRLPGHRLLLPENPCRVPRKSTMNLMFF